ncbi:LysR family transcriptional regulator [Acinetobacter qingfengensis]|uniref:HTH lysR-type domain-containing protein n=1 Tax=Acinetobacter qingfengensis TaxID=1262585 RepID=A0A1E7R5E8_9GAMM|nr:LysR family transcriptional regulator [Acinetobacter qingfengensis]KAA8730918.1 LysR family transcriptional regulator [Acinetobacter qingfengensis]OEY94483.1 hypothetical protein BJI46_03865 [Acinetobacter qingfengensis]
MRLDLFDIQLFLDIVETGSFSKAAERCALSVQACSERIKKLEQRFCPLFSRHATGVQLTAAGQVFYRHACLLQQQFQHLQQEFTQFHQQENLSITLWCNSSAQSEYLPHILPNYLLHYPQLQLHIREAETTIILEKLRQHEAQLALISDVFDTSDLITQHFVVDPLCLICSNHHSLSQYHQLNPDEIIAQDWVGLMPQHALQQSIEQYFKQHGKIMHYRLRLLDFSALIQVVSTGVGIAIIPTRIAQRFINQFDFRQIALSGKWANRNLLLAYHPEHQLTVTYQDFYQYLCDVRRQFQIN